MDNNYLNNVILHIKFPRIFSLYNDHEDSSNSFYEIVKNEFPIKESELSNKINIFIDENTLRIIEEESDEKFITWFFKNDNNKFISFNADELILNYSGEIYLNFATFIKDVELILNALDIYSVNEINLTELRYINQINDISIIKDFLFNVEFNSKNLIQTLTRTELEIDDYKLVFQFGQFNPEYPSVASQKDFILDYNCILNFDDNINDLIKNLHEMHNIIKERFKRDTMEKKKKKYKDTKIDMSHYKRSGPRLIKSFDIKF